MRMVTANFAKTTAKVEPVIENMERVLFLLSFSRCEVGFTVAFSGCDPGMVVESGSALHRKWTQVEMAPQ